MTKETLMEAIPFGYSLLIPPTSIVNTSPSGKTYTVDVTILRKYSYDGTPILMVYGSYKTAKGNICSYSEPVNASFDDYEKLCAQIPKAKYTTKHPEVL